MKYYNITNYAVYYVGYLLKDQNFVGVVRKEEKEKLFSNIYYSRKLNQTIDLVSVLFMIYNNQLCYPLCRIVAKCHNFE